MSPTLPIPAHPDGDWPALREDIAATNLLRMWWLLLTSTAMSVLFAVFNFVQGKYASFVPWEIFDIGGSAVFLLLFWLARKRRLPDRTCWLLSPAYFAFWLVLMDAYYFNALRVYGETATYAIGVVTPAILILLPPRIFLSLLIPNHIVFCALLFGIPELNLDRSSEGIQAAFINGTLGVLVASLAAWFLFSARRTNFRNERLLLQRTQEVHAAALHLGAILENIPFQAWLRDVHGRFLAVNGKFAEANGLPREKIIGRLMSEIYSPERTELYSGEDRLIMQKQEKTSFERPLKESRGLRWYEVFKSPVVDENGAVLGTAGLARDITMRKEIEEQLLAAGQTKSEFLATMSHEIRTPMNIVLGYAGILRDMPMAPDQREHVEAIYHSGQLLLAIINDILDFSKMEADKLTLQPETVSVRELASRLEHMFRSQAGEKGLALRFFLDEKVPSYVEADLHRLEQVLVNLLSNAVKFTETGSVELHVFAEPGKSTPKTWELCFQVTDTGIGIPPDQIENLFEPFSQADTTIARRFSGTGLGLVIVQRLCEMMNGSISVQSSPGRGSTFTAAINVLESDAPSTQEKSGPDSGATKDFSTLRVLVVEDNATNRKLVSILLKRLGVTPTPVESGEQALRLIPGETYDLILMDVQMPGMDGFETTRKIRAWEKAHPKRRTNHIVALTAFAMPDDKARCLEAGMNDYLSKPIKPDALKRALEISLAEKARA